MRVGSRVKALEKELKQTRQAIYDLIKEENFSKKSNATMDNLEATKKSLLHKEKYNSLVHESKSCRLEVTHGCPI